VSDRVARREYLPLDERRERLLDAAVEVMAADGAGAVSLRSVAARAGVAHRVVHYAFGSKAGLVAAILTRESNRRMALVWDAPLQPGSLEDAVAVSLRVFVADVREHPDRYQAMTDLASTARTDPLLKEAADAEAHCYHAAIVARLQEWSASTALQLAIPVDVAAATLLASAGGLADWWLTSRDDELLDPVIEQFSSAFRHAAARASDQASAASEPSLSPVTR
jgi:AcrR family transcriptional regulator